MKIEVIALSIDQGGMPVVREFFLRVGVQCLRLYVDTFGDASSSLGVSGVPLTLLMDRDGREIGRKLGPATWDVFKAALVRRSPSRPSSEAVPRQGPGSDLDADRE